MSGLDAIPSIPASALPADVRAGSVGDQKAYRAALGFERILLGEVMQDITKAGGLQDSPYASAIQDAMSDALGAGGGLGLGRQLFATMRPESSTPTGGAADGGR